MAGIDRRCSTLLLLATLFGMLTFPSDVAAQSWADKMFKVTKHDFRTVGRGTKAEFYFEFTNLYEEDVHVSAVRTSCGCTTPTLTSDTLTTHQTAAVVATFNTNTFIGQKAATITVVFDKPKYAEVQLNVSGFIRTDITFDPPEINYGELAAGQAAEQEVVITHNGNSQWQITDVRSHCKHLQVRLNPAERTASTVRYRMLVKLDDSMSEGDIHERLTLISNDTSFPTTEMAVTGRIRPTVDVSPATVSLGTTTVHGKSDTRLVVRADEPFGIVDVHCGDGRFSFDVPTGTKKVHFVKMHFSGDGSDEPIAQEVRIVTDLPGDKSASCVVTGRIAEATDL
jgi:hypothetical protein